MKSLLVVLGLVGVGASAVPDAIEHRAINLDAGIAESPNGVPRNNTPVHFHLAFAGEHGMAVSWETNTDTDQHMCKYGTSARNFNTRASGSSVTDTAIFTHTVILPKLAESTRYYYSCGDPSVGMGEVFSFMSSLPVGSRTPFTVAIIGDMGIRQSNGVSASLVARKDSYDFAIHPGDLGYADDWYLYLSTYNRVYSQFMNDIEPFAAEMPYMGLPGNHEATCSQVTPHLCPRHQRNFTAYRKRWRFPSVESGAGEVENMWYSFDYGMFHFVQISTETDFPNAAEGPGKWLSSGPFGDQMTWLRADLAKAEKNRANVPWIVVSGHRPMWFSTGNQNVDVQKAFLPLLHQYNIDFYFAGHEHTYERYYPIGQDGKASQTHYYNPKDPVYIVNGAGGNVEGHQIHKETPDYFAYRDGKHYGWTRMTVLNVTSVKLEYITENDDITDEFIVTKTWKK